MQTAEPPHLTHPPAHHPPSHLPTHLQPNAAGVGLAPRGKHDFAAVEHPIIPLLPLAAEVKVVGAIRGLLHPAAPGQASVCRAKGERARGRQLVAAVAALLLLAAGCLLSLCWVGLGVNLDSPLPKVLCHHRPALLIKPAAGKQWQGSG